MLGFPTDYRDPLYSQLARAAEAKFGLPTGILDAIRTRGERSNADQISPAGARTPYQFIPPTRKGFLRVYGIDPWKDPTSATDAAALHVLDDYKRTHSWNEAVARYNGGQHPHADAYRYAQKVGDFDKKIGDTEMALGQSIYPAPYYGGVDPLAPEPIKDTAPIPGDPGPSASMPATAPVAAKKRGGILGALESVFMPDPDSRWAAALRGGIWDAKANQAAYKEKVATDAIARQTANAKLRQLLTKGEYQIVGNNVLHIPTDGSPAEIITAPRTPGEKETLLQMWKDEPDGTKFKQLLESILAGANSTEALASQERRAATRAGATVQAARVRSSATGKTNSSKLPTGFILDQ